MMSTLQLQTMQEGYANGAIPPRVEFQGRFAKSPKAELGCLLLFLIGLVSYLALGIFIVTSVNYEVIREETGFRVEIADSLKEDLARYGCPTARRMLASNECGDLWCVFAQNVQVPVVTILAVPVIGAAWIGLMYLAPLAVTWGSILFNIVLYALIGIAILSNGLDSTLGILFLVYAGVLLIILGMTVKKVNQAASHLKTAIRSLSHNLSIFAATGVLEVILLGFLALHWYFMIQATKVAQVDSSCELSVFPLQISRMTQFMTIFLVWVVAYLNSAKLVTTSMVVGSWFFDQTDSPSRPAFSALKTSLTSSSGPLSIGSLVVAVVENIVRKATSYFWWTNPVGCVLKCTFLILQGCIMALTRFALIAHAFTGEGFFESSRRVFEIMKKNFVGGYVVSRVGVSVVETGANGLSLCVGLLAWYWIDKENGWDTLEDVTDLFNGLIGFLAFILVYLYLTRRPMLTLVIIVLVMQFVSDLFPAEIWAPVGGLFVSCIAMIILSFQGDVVLDALDTIFVAFAVGNEANVGAPLTGDRGLAYTMMVDDFKDVSVTVK